MILRVGWFNRFKKNQWEYKIVENNENIAETHSHKRSLITEGQNLVLKDTTANPIPLGLFGFGLTTVLLSLSIAGFYSLNNMILSMAFVFAGLGEIIACLMAYKKGDTLAMVAFGSFGLFWWSYVFLLLVPAMTIFTTAAVAVQAPGPASFAAYFFMWAILAAGLFLASLINAGRGLQAVLLGVVVLFFLLMVGEITGIATITTIAGYDGILAGLIGVYVAIGSLINGKYGREVLPI